MMPVARPVADFQSERMTEDDMNRRIQQMEMYRSAQEPKRPGQSTPYRPMHQPPHPHQQYQNMSNQKRPEQPFKQPFNERQVTTSTHLPKSTDSLKVQYVHETCVVSSESPRLILPERVIATQIKQIWVPLLESSVELIEEKDRIFHIIDLDLENCSSHEIPVHLPQKRYYRLIELLQDLNEAVARIKELQYKVEFIVENDRITFLAGSFENVQNNPDLFQTAIHGPFHKVHGVKLQWPVASKLAVILGYRSSICREITDQKDRLMFRGDDPVSSFGLESTPFLHLTLPQCTKTKWIIDIPKKRDDSVEKQYSQTFIDADEGAVLLVSRDDAMNALVPTVPFTCEIQITDPSRPLFDISFPDCRSPLYVRTKSTIIV